MFCLKHTFHIPNIFPAPHLSPCTFTPYNNDSCIYFTILQLILFSIIRCEKSEPLISAQTSTAPWKALLSRLQKMQIQSLVNYQLPSKTNPGHQRHCITGVRTASLFSHYQFRPVTTMGWLFQWCTATLNQIEEQGVKTVIGLLVALSKLSQNIPGG